MMLENQPGPRCRRVEVEDDVGRAIGRGHRQTRYAAIGGDRQTGSGINHGFNQVLKLLGPPSFAPFSLANCAVIAVTVPNTRSAGCSYGCRGSGVGAGESESAVGMRGTVSPRILDEAVPPVNVAGHSSPVTRRRAPAGGDDGSSPRRIRAPHPRSRTAQVHRHAAPRPAPRSSVDRRLRREAAAGPRPGAPTTVSPPM